MPLITPPSATLSLPVATQFAAVSESGGQLDLKNEPEYAILKRRIQDAGLLKKRPADYALSITTNSVLLILCLVTGDVLLGMSYGWWVQKHNRHHGNPNDVDLDPDIKVGAIAYTDEQARARRGAGRLAAMYQAYLFFPLTTFLAWSLHLTGLT